ncbi:MAG TPA: serine hydrolase [Candidatus Saccharimonadales bacterium]|nr:serine hydrolase [Candidatus Saccharimonadales bacterium]
MSWIATLSLVLLSLLPWQPAGLTKTLESWSIEPAGAEVNLNQAPPLPKVQIPIRRSNPNLNLQAASAYAIDVETAQPLYEQNANTQQPIASVTKLITTLVILQDHPLSDKITVPTLPAYTPADDLLGLTPGEVFSVSDLLQAALVHSANDAADALAIADSGSREAFATKMNAYVAKWGIEGTQFSNPTGLTDAGNSATAMALGKLSLLALQRPAIRQFGNQGGGVVADAAGRKFALRPTDDLLSTGRFHGIKTGYTAAAGGCFVGLTTINGHEIITVVLGSPDRFGETVQLANWIQANYIWL